jgi:cell division protein FtsW
MDRQMLERQRFRPASTTAEVLPRRHRPDYWLLILCAILLTVGLIVIYAISPGLSLSANVSQNYYIDKQLISVVMGILAFIVVINMRLEWWLRLKVPLIVLAGVSAVAVRLVGQQVNGAYRWIQIGGVSFQSAELIKIALLIWLASFLADRIKTNTLNSTKQTLRPVLIALLIIGFIVAGIQSDLGSTGVIVTMMAAMVYIAGMPLKKVLSIGGIVLLLAVLAVVITPYRRGRVLTFLHPTSNCQTTGYQSCQALIAVGSGGMIGLGLGRDVQAYGYLPEPANDSIFAIFGEKFGFIGSIILLGLFVALFARIKNIMERAPNNFTRLLVVGILAWLSTQTLINIGAMIGLLPLKGITLPFISYGGTSVVFSMVAIGLVFQISRYTIHAVPTLNHTEGNRHEDRPNGRRLRGAYNPTASSRS